MKLKGIIYDLAGTLCDRYSLSPVLSLIEAFKQDNISITMKEARMFMGLDKRVHITKTLELPHIKAQCMNNNIHNPNVIYDHYKKVQIDTLITDAVDGAVYATNVVKRLGLKNGVTTGYSTDVSSVVLESLRKQNVIIDNLVSSDEVKFGRPYPYMIFRCLENMEIENPNTVIKIGDTIADIHEGLNAGCWTVGVSKWSNEMNFESLDQAENATNDEILRRTEHAKNILHHAGADFVIDDLTTINKLVTKIDNMMDDGLNPTIYRVLRQRDHFSY